MNEAHDNAAPVADLAIARPCPSPGMIPTAGLQWSLSSEPALGPSAGAELLPRVIDYDDPLLFSIHCNRCGPMKAKATGVGWYLCHECGMETARRGKAIAEQDAGGMDMEGDDAS